MNEYIGKKVAVVVPAESTVAEADIRPDAFVAAEKACLAKGLHATDVKLSWSGSWAEAIERGTLDAEYRDCKMDDYTVYLYEAIARESVSA
jgi:hypothetical protein